MSSTHKVVWCFDDIPFEINVGVGVVVLLCTLFSFVLGNYAIFHFYLPAKPLKKSLKCISIASTICFELACICTTGLYATSFLCEDGISFMIARESTAVFYTIAMLLLYLAIGLRVLTSFKDSIYQMPKLFKRGLYLIGILQSIVLSLLYFSILQSDERANTLAAIFFLIHVIMCGVLLAMLVKKLKTVAAHSDHGLNSKQAQTQNGHGNEDCKEDQDQDQERSREQSQSNSFGKISMKRLRTDSSALVNGRLDSRGAIRSSVTPSHFKHKHKDKNVAINISRGSGQDIVSQASAVISESMFDIMTNGTDSARLKSIKSIKNAPSRRGLNSQKQSNVDIQTGTGHDGKQPQRIKVHMARHAGSALSTSTNTNTNNTSTPNGISSNFSTFSGGVYIHSSSASPRSVHFLSHPQHSQHSKLSQLSQSQNSKSHQDSTNDDHDMDAYVHPEMITESQNRTCDNNSETRQQKTKTKTKTKSKTNSNRVRFSHMHAKPFAVQTLSVEATVVTKFVHGQKKDDKNENQDEQLSGYNLSTVNKRTEENIGQTTNQKKKEIFTKTDSPHDNVPVSDVVGHQSKHFNFKARGGRKMVASESSDNTPVFAPVPSKLRMISALASISDQECDHDEDAHDGHDVDDENINKNGIVDVADYNAYNMTDADVDCDGKDNEPSIPSIRIVSDDEDDIDQSANMHMTGIGSGTATLTENSLNRNINCKPLSPTKPSLTGKDSYTGGTRTPKLDLPQLQLSNNNSGNSLGRSRTPTMGRSPSVSRSREHSRSRSRSRRSRHGQEDVYQVMIEPLSRFTVIVLWATVTTTLTMASLLVRSRMYNQYTVSISLACMAIDQTTNVICLLFQNAFANSLYQKWCKRCDEYVKLLCYQPESE